jgi:hypothetical protein
MLPNARSVANRIMENHSKNMIQRKRTRNKKMPVISQKGGVI